MRFRYIGIIVALFFAGAFVLYYAGSDSAPNHPAEPPAPGSQENPRERARFEWLRLHDPATGRVPDGIRARELEFVSKLPRREALNALQKGNGASSVALVNWNPRGPYNIGGRTRALGIDVSDPNIIVAGAISGGMWRSTDAGFHWTKTSDPAQLHSVTCLTQDTRPGKTNIWYYGSGEWRGNSASGGGASYRGDGIFKSTDNGQSWQQLPATASGTPQTFDNMFDYVWNIVTDPADSLNDVVYAATYGGINRSTDGGASWTPVLGSLSNNSGYNDVAITSTGVVYATLSSSGSIRGIFRSPDGVTWTNITPPNWPNTYRRIVLGIAPSNEDVVYLLAQTDGVGINGHSFWKYTYLGGDGSGAGGTWEDRSANVQTSSTSSGRDFQSYASYCQVLKVHPNDENVVFIGGIDLYRSTDAFATPSNITWIGGWLYENNYDHHADQHVVVFSPTDPNVMYSGHDGGVSRTLDNMATNVNWIGFNEGYVTTQFYAIAIDYSTAGNDVVIGGMQDNGTWFTNNTNPIAPWNEVQGGDGAFCAITDNRRYYYASFQNGWVYRWVLDQFGNGSEWTRVDPAGGNGYLFINPFALDPSNNDMMYVAAGSFLWRNSDLTAIPPFNSNPTGINWTQLSNAVVVGPITAIGISTTPANRVYYGNGNGQVFRIDDAHIGNPGNTNVSGAQFPVGAYVSSIAVDPADADRVLVAFSNYNVVSLFYTADGGATWQAVSGNLEENPDGSGNGPSVRWVSMLDVNGSPIYFAGSSTGLYSTTVLNGDSTVWVQEGASEIGNVVVDMVLARDSDDRVTVGTHGAGIYSADVVLTGIAENPPLAASGFRLEQNYPNPFNPVTNLKFQIGNFSNGASGMVRLEVFDLLGQKVKTLVNEPLSPGAHEVQWDGTDYSGRPVASGTYVYHLQAGDRQLSRTMQLIR